MNIESNDISNVNINNEHVTILFNNADLVYRDDGWLTCTYKNNDGVATGDYMKVYYRPDNLYGKINSLYCYDKKQPIIEETVQSHYKWGEVYVSDSKFIDGKMVLYIRGDYFGFRNCNNLVEVYMPKGFIGVLNASGDSTTKVFDNCVNLTKITFSDTHAPGTYTYANCTKLSTVVYEGKPYDISESCFDGCTVLRNIDTTKFKRISKFAFRNTMLSSLDLNNVTSVGVNPFAQCSQLTTINIPDSITAYTSTENKNCIINVSTKTLITVASIDLPIPTDIKIVGESAAEDNHTITQPVVLPDVTEIKTKAFYHAWKLTNMEFGSGLKTIGSHGLYLEWYSSKLRKIFKFHSKTPPTIQSNTFVINTSSTTLNVTRIYVPNESLDAYKTAANWSEFASVIYGYDETETE